MTAIDTSRMPHLIDPADPVAWLASADMADEQGEHGWAERLRRVGNLAMLGGPARATASLAISGVIGKAIADRDIRTPADAVAHYAGDQLPVTAILDGQSSVRAARGELMWCNGTMFPPESGEWPLGPAFRWGVIVGPHDVPAIICRLRELPRFMSDENNA